ncbi:MAG: hypothetical protein JJP05_08565 [cyanobacterium endosymbiont of Rhopalodia gibba]
MVLHYQVRYNLEISNKRTTIEDIHLRLCQDMETAELKREIQGISTRLGKTQEYL